MDLGPLAITSCSIYIVLMDKDAFEGLRICRGKQNTGYSLSLVCLCLVTWSGGGSPHEQSCFMQSSQGLVGDSSVEGESWLAFGILSVLNGDLFEPESQYVVQAGLGLKISLSQPSKY